MKKKLPGVIIFLNMNIQQQQKKHQIHIALWVDILKMWVMKCEQHRYIDICEELEWLMEKKSSIWVGCNANRQPNQLKWFERKWRHARRVKIEIKHRQYWWLLACNKQNTYREPERNLFNWRCRAFNKLLMRTLITCECELCKCILLSIVCPIRKIWPHTIVYAFHL